MTSLIQTDSGCLYELDPTKMTWAKLVPRSDTIHVTYGYLAVWPNLRVGKSANIYSLDANDDMYTITIKRIVSLNRLWRSIISDGEEYCLRSGRYRHLL